MTAQEEHLVSVGMPIYNRPDLLESRLANVTGQTYKNLEIVISDNASPDPRVQEVAHKYANRDSRIRYLRQNENAGISANFRLVLRESTGKYFAWAADDDEWDDNFVETCVEGIGRAQLFMPKMAVKHLNSGSIQKTDTPRLSLDESAAVNAKRFLNALQPGLIYGLHDREALNRIFRNEDTFDLSDILIVLRAILADGVVVGDGAEYRAGVPGGEYEPKPIGTEDNPNQFSYRGFLRAAFSAIARSPNLSASQKIILYTRLVLVTMKLMAHLTEIYPSSSKPHHKIYCFVRRAPKRLKNLLFSRRVKH
ncbi:MAG: glycosyltransferase family 2 protein [Rhizobiaceae bacterium]